MSTLTCFSSLLNALAQHCNRIASFAIVIRCRLSVVCRLSVCRRLWRECIVTKRLKSRSYTFVAHCLNSLPAKCGDEIQRGPLIGALKLRWGGFQLRDTISQKWCEIELRWQLIINRKSYVGFRLQRKLTTLNDLERQCYECCDLTAEARIIRFSLYLVPLHLSYPHIKFDDEIETNSLRISSESLINLSSVVHGNASILWRKHCK